MTLVSCGIVRPRAPTVKWNNDWPKSTSELGNTEETRKILSKIAADIRKECEEQVQEELAVVRQDPVEPLERELSLQSGDCLLAMWKDGSRITTAAESIKRTKQNALSSLFFRDF